MWHKVQANALRRRFLESCYSPVSLWLGRYGEMEDQSHAWQRKVFPMEL